MNDDFTSWIEATVTPGKWHEILPGRRVVLGTISHRHELTAEQAVLLAYRLLDCAAVPVVAEFSTNERHLLNLLSWREREARQAKDELVVVGEQLNVAADRAQSWKNIADAKDAEIARLKAGLGMISQLLSDRVPCMIAEATLGGANLLDEDVALDVCEGHWKSDK